MQVSLGPDSQTPPPDPRHPVMDDEPQDEVNGGVCGGRRGGGVEVIGTSVWACLTLAINLKQDEYTLIE